MRKNLMLGLALFAIMAFALAACAPTTPATTPEPTDEETPEPTEMVTDEATAEMTDEATAEATDEATAEATEDSTLGTEENPIVISFVPSGDADTIIASAEQLTDFLSEETGLVIEASVPTSFVGSIEAMCAGEAHIATLNTFSYVVAHERGCADVALASTRFDSPTYTGQIIVNADAGIETIADLKGHSFCRPDPFSTSGWIIPSITMRAEGIDPDTDLEIVDAGGHPDVVRAVANGDCDAGATFVDARTNVQEELPDVMETVLVLAVSQPIPNDTVAFHPDFPEEMREEIVAAFLSLTEDEEAMAIIQELYRWEGFVEVDDAFYDEFRQLLEAAGVNVEDFIGE
jgi:phosphonate transport system substrate-binding protein